MQKIRWSKTEDEIILKYSDNIKLVYDLLTNRTVQAIQTRRKTLRITRKQNKANINFFSEYNNFSCYWAGFIAGDGNVDDRGRLTIALGNRDRSHIEKFMLDVNYKGNIHKASDITCRVQVCSNYQWKEDLEKNFNITPRKTFTLLPPIQINKFEFILSYLRGLFDADGSVFWVPSPRGQSVCVSFVGTKALLDWVKLYVDEIIGENVYKVKNHKSVYEIRMYGPNAIKFLKTLYSVDGPYLDRKKEKFNEILEVYNNKNKNI